MRRRPVYTITALMFFIPFWGMAQSPVARPVAVMPFTGEEDAVNAQFRNSVADEIKNLKGNFPPTSINLPSGMAAEDLAPDEPPPSSMVGGRQYVVTGASFPDEGEHHLQVWLWDVKEPTLVYTDELVCEEVDEAEEFVALLVEWVFSHVPPIPKAEEEDNRDSDPVPWNPWENWEPLVEDTIPTGLGETNAPPQDDIDKLLWVGFQGGGFHGFYYQDNISDWSDPLSITVEAGVLISWQLLKWFAVQGEFLSVWENAIFSDTNVLDWTWSMKPMGSFKFTLPLDPFLLAPSGGVYYNIPMSGQRWTDKDGDSMFFNSMGWTAGLTFGVNLSKATGNKKIPGRIFLDIRAGGDFGYMKYQDILLQRSTTISVTAGYEIGFFNRDIKTVGRTR